MPRDCRSITQARPRPGSDCPRRAKPVVAQDSTKDKQGNDQTRTHTPAAATQSGCINWPIWVTGSGIAVPPRDQDGQVARQDQEQKDDGGQVLTDKL